MISPAPFTSTEVESLARFTREQGGTLLLAPGVPPAPEARLKRAGVLVMTRWLLPGSSAEAQRLVALAAESLEREGLSPVGAHLVALSFPTYITDRAGEGTVARITTLAQRVRPGRDESSSP